MRTNVQSQGHLAGAPPSASNSAISRFRVGESASQAVKLTPNPASSVVVTWLSSANKSRQTPDGTPSSMGRPTN